MFTFSFNFFYMLAYIYSTLYIQSSFISLPCNTLTHTTMTFRFSTWNPYSRIRKIHWKILHCILYIRIYCHVLFYSIPTNTTTPIHNFSIRIETRRKRFFRTYTEWTERLNNMMFGIHSIQLVLIQQRTDNVK